MPLQGQCSGKSAKAEDKAVSEGEGQSTGAELLSIGKGGTGDKHLSLTHDGLGSWRCWAENPVVGLCRVREEDICFLCLFPSEVGALYQPRASLPAQSIPAQPQQQAHLCRHAPSHFVARHCRSVLKMQVSACMKPCPVGPGQCHSSGREGWLPPPHLELCEEDRSPTCATSTGLCDFQKPLPT